MKNDRVGVGVIGAGFIAETRARCYDNHRGMAKIVAVASRTREKAQDYADRHGVPTALAGYQDLLSLPEVDVVDLCIPNHLHRAVAEAAAAAGKHVICTKPLTAYIGQDLPRDCRDDEISGRDPQTMLEVALADAQAMVDATRKAGVHLMYGENWIYAPSITKAAALVRASGGAILEMRGGEGHSGSHTPYSKVWRYTGGGALLRLGAHPVGTMVYLKAAEGLAREGKPIRPVSVTAEVGDLSRVPAVTNGPRAWVATGWKDVENWGSAILTFEDGARGIVWASDTLVGGMESRLDVFLSNSHIKCFMSPNNLVQAFAPDPEVFESEYLIEKGETKAGWSSPMPDEDWTSGHSLMCRDFIEAVAQNRPALSTGQLGLETVKIIYSAYCSARWGRRVDL